MNRRFPSQVAALIFLSTLVAQAQRLPLGPNDPGMAGTSSERLGEAMLAVDDLDGDGAPEFAVTLPLADTAGGVDTGLVRFLSARPGGGILLELTGQNPGDQFGASLTRAPDLDGDGKDEVVIGAPGFQGGSGALYVFFTSTGLTQLLIAGAAGASLGLNVKLVTDMDGDGVEDVAAYALSNRVGRVSFISLASGSLLGFVQSPMPDDSFGSTMELVGDLDGNGTEDIAIGAPREDSGAENGGAVYIVSSETVRFIVPRCGGVIPVNRQAALTSDLNGASIGASIARLPDLDLDGHSEIAIGAPGEERVYIMSSRDFCIIRELGAHAPGAFGAALLSGIDLDADGVQDLAVSSPELSNGGSVELGGVTIYSTNDWSVRTYFEGGENGEQFGRVLAAGPGNGSDGNVDLLIGCPSARNSAGLAYLGAYFEADVPRIRTAARGGKGEVLSMSFEFDGSLAGRSYIIVTGRDPGVTKFGKGLRLDLAVDLPLTNFIAMNGDYGSEDSGGFFFAGGSGVLTGSHHGNAATAHFRIRPPVAMNSTVLYCQAVVVTDDGLVVSRGGSVVALAGDRYVPETGLVRLFIDGSTKTRLKIWDVEASRYIGVDAMPENYSVLVSSSDPRVSVADNGLLSATSGGESRYGFDLEVVIRNSITGSSASWILKGIVLALLEDGLRRVVGVREVVVASVDFGSHSNGSSCRPFNRAFGDVVSGVNHIVGPETSLSMSIGMPQINFFSSSSCPRAKSFDGGTIFRSGFPSVCSNGETVFHQLEFRLLRDDVDGRLAVVGLCSGIYVRCNGGGSTTCSAHSARVDYSDRLPVILIPGQGGCR